VIFESKSKLARVPRADGSCLPTAIERARILGLDAALGNAVAFKLLATPLSNEQLAEAIQIPPVSGADRTDQLCAAGMAWYIAWQQLARQQAWALLSSSVTVEMTASMLSGGFTSG
jgi:hypothetical protein